MTFLQALILGIIQGLTEFLPISSSAHLVLVPYILGWEIPAEQIFPFDVLVQLGTLAAVILYFWKDLIQILSGWLSGILQKKPFESTSSRLGWYLILASIPAGLAGVLIKDIVEDVFSKPVITALFLFGTAILLIIAEFAGKRSRNMDQMTWKDAAWIGIFQALSLFPGISRSGSTIAGGLTRNLDRSSAARFSFLMSVPVMLGAGGLSALDLLDIQNLSQFLPVILTGFVTAGIVGYLSIHWLLSYLKKGSLIGFAIYCTAVAIFILIWSYVIL